MHLICLGVVKKLIVSLWSCGKPPFKMSYNQLSLIFEKLISQSSNMPIDFNRKPRSLLEAKRWKAKELRHFLLYTGPIVLRDKYLNFMSLHVSVTILSVSKFSDHINYANSLLKYFVDTFMKLYKPEHVSHNIHNLLHIANDVKKLGPLHNFGAFAFENYLQSILRLLRTGHHPLSQIVKRKSELDSLNNRKPLQKKKFPFVSNKHNNGPILIPYLHLSQYKKIIFSNFELHISESNNCCSLKNGDIIVIRNILVCSNDYLIIGQKFQCLENYYTSPIESSIIGIFLASNLGKPSCFNYKDIDYKCVKLQFKSKFVIFPLIHTLQ